MPNEEVSLQAGGAATAAGMAFQNRVAAWLATRILAEADASILWNLPTSSTVEFIRCETEQPVDDIMMGASDGGLAFVQVKRALSLERSAESPLAKTLSQFVRQTLRTAVHNSQPARPWDRPLDHRRDRLVLAVGRTAARTITSIFPAVLNKIRLLRREAALEEAAHSQEEKEVLNTTSEHIKTAWQTQSGTFPNEGEIRELLALVYIHVLDVEPGGLEEREARDTLRRTVLLRANQEGGAWATLIEECSRFAAQRSGADRHQLRQILDRAGISIRAPRNYRDDIEKLASYSADTIKALASFATISLFRDNLIKIVRPSTSQLRAAGELGSLVVTGEPGLGKSGALHDLAVALQANGHNLFFVAADRLESSSLASLNTELALEHPILDVLENWHGDGPAFLITDALDAARSEYGMRTLQELIRRTLDQRGRWRVVASIRRFDLRYNQGLSALFAGEQLAQFQDPEFPGTRVFLVPRLSPDELLQVETQSESMGRLIQAIDGGPNQEMRALLRVPFNLRLLGELIGQGLALEELTPIKTQLELLDRYWQERVIRIDHMGDAREAVLRQAATKMVESRALRVARTDIALDSTSAPILNDLLSADLLQEHQAPLSRPDRNTLTFAHHLLFDYAVARLLFRIDPARLVQQIAADPERVVAFRPSLALHFRHEWEMEAVNRSRFWDLVFRLVEAPKIPLIGKIVGPTEAVELLKRIQDIEPLVARVKEEQQQSADNRCGRDAVRHLINALTARRLSPDQLVGPKAQPWCELAAELSESVGILAYPLARLVNLLSDHTTILRRPKGPSST